MEAYINGIGNISPQDTFKQDLFPDNLNLSENNQLLCVEPDYKKIITTGLTRRMSRIIKMGISAAFVCLEDAKITIPDAIITGTGLGCLKDTEKFLSSVIVNQEQLLSPTSFIQSTHNVISGQIALLLQCNNYNHTYVHRGFSFETALTDSMMMLNEGNADNILLGGIDEITEDYFNITKRLGNWKNENANNLDLLNSGSPGTIAGEGASFFLLSNKNEKSYAKLRAVKTFYKPGNKDDILKEINTFLESNGTSADKIDLIVTGLNGDSRFDSVYFDVLNSVFTKNNKSYFKHLCGEYNTAVSFALWLATKIIHSQIIPDYIKLGDFQSNNVGNILIYNHYKNINHSLLLVSTC